MLRTVAFLLLASCFLVAQPQSEKAPSAPPADRKSSQAGPGEHKDAAQPKAPDAGQSSSKETAIDLSAPQDDAKDHPGSALAVQEMEDAAGLYEGDEIGGIQEFKPWNPHKADKDVEVGDFYFKSKNYRAALDRYREALYYKDNDAVATFRLAVCQEKLGDPAEARKGYESYLKILPHGPFSEEARQALKRLKPASVGEAAVPGSAAPK